MKLSGIATIVAAGILLAEGMPRMTTVEPASGKAGDIIVVSGENLAKDAGAKGYLTDGKNDILVTVSEQTATSLKFKIPPKAAGRLALMIETAGKDVKLIEQPVKLTIE